MNPNERHAPVTEQDRHRCQSGPACRAAVKITDSQGQRRVGAITGDPDTLCEPCREHLTRCIRNLDNDYAMLRRTLGERPATGGDFVRASRTPALPVNTTSEALMAAIVEVVDLAAALIADHLDADQPNGRRNAPKVTVTQLAAERLHEAGQHAVPGDRIDPREHTPAAIAETLVRPDEQARLDACLRMLEPNINTLIAIGTVDINVWLKPERCERHDRLITIAESYAQAAQTPEQKDHAATQLRGLWTAAGRCDQCGGWYEHGQARTTTETTGLDVARQITDLHRTIRAHLGHTRLRHHMGMPCPAINKHGIYCGAMTVGRDDGSEWVNCTTCGSQWTVNEYDFLQTLVIEDKEIQMLRYLLAEAYWRLDQVQHVTDTLADDERMNLAGAGPIILDQLHVILEAGEGHRRPDERTTSRTK